MITDVFFILIVHWVADFVLQDEEWAINKSSSLYCLLKHTLTYSLVFFAAALIANDFKLYLCFLFFVCTFVLHTITDYFSSKVVAKKFKKKHYGSSVPNFGAFTIIGLDQLAHYIQLLVCWNLIFWV